MADRFIGTTDVAKRLDCSADRVRQLEREGKLPAEKMPSGQRLFRQEDVERLAEERARQKQAASAT